jgi:hypothetical protein
VCANGEVIYYYSDQSVAGSRQIARVVPIFENVKAEHRTSQRDKSLNDPALPLWASTQAIAQEVCAYAAKY